MVGINVRFRTDDALDYETAYTRIHHGATVRPEAQMRKIVYNIKRRHPRVAVCHPCRGDSVGYTMHAH